MGGNKQYMTKEMEDLELIAKSSLAWENYKGKTVLVTGATGLIGSLVVKAILYYNRLNNGNISVVAAIRNEKKAEKIFADFLKDTNLCLLACDVTKGISVDREVDYIIHTVSLTASKMMVEHPVLTIETSYQGTRNILELAVEKKVKGMVYVSSMEVYGKPDPNLEYIKEKDLGYIDLTNVRSSYSEGKRICECLCTAYAAEYGVSVRIARLAQTFGAGILETDTRVYAQFAKSALKGEDIILHTDGMSEGNYCYTRDVVKALLMLGYSGEDGESYNIVNEASHMKIKEMANLVANDIMGGKIKVLFDIPESDKVYGYAPAVKMHLSSKKMNALGWTAEVGMKDAYIRMISDLKNV